MPDLPTEAETFIAELDAAVEAHMAWSRRILRCAVSARPVLTTIGTTPAPITDNKSLTLTVTLGLARVGESEDLASAISRADLALYEGKESGRNRFVVAPS